MKSLFTLICAACMTAPSGAPAAPRPSPAAAPPAGVTWQAPLEVARGGGVRGPWQQDRTRYDHVDDGTVAFAPDGDLVVAWVDQRARDVFLQRYAPTGKPRHARPINVSRSPQIFSWLPRLVVAGDDVHVLWQEIVFSGGSHGGEIFHARSGDGGASFERPHNLSRSVPGDGKGRLDAKTWSNGSFDLARGPDGTLYAAWTEYDGPLWLARSRDGGGSWSAPTQLAGTALRPARAPALATSQNAIHVAWTTGADPRADVQLATSTDGGESFAAPRVVERTPGYSDAPKLAVDARGTLHLVYAEGRGPTGPAHIRYARSTDGGRTFSASRELSRMAGIASATFPSLAVEGDRVVVVWDVQRDARQSPRGLAIARSTDVGKTFGAATAVRGSEGAGGNGSHQGRLMERVALRGDAIVVVNSSLRLGRSSRVWLVRGSG